MRFPIARHGILIASACWCWSQSIVQAQEPARHRSNGVVIEAPRELVDEIAGLKNELRELRRSDAEKQRKIDDLARRIEVMEGPALLPDPHTPRLTTSRAAAGRALAPTHARTEQEQQQESALDRAIKELETQDTRDGQESALDRAVRDLESAPPAPPMATAGTGAPQLQLMNISLDALFAVGTSTEKEASIRQLEGGGHDPHKRGFTVQNVELFIAGAVDPYLDGAMNLIHFIDPEGETVVELEECYLTTRSLPCGLQVKAGQFFTEFGRLNPQHPHSWHWQDQPIINTRLFGPDGMRGPGVRLSWLVPVEWFSQLFVGAQNANGETLASFLASEEFFEERPIGGRPFVEQDVRDLADLAYLIRWENSWTSCCEEATWLLGFSGAAGPNATGPDGHTHIFGADLTMKWRPAKNERGWPFVIWQSEIMERHYVADDFFDPRDPLDPLDDLALGARTLHDWGFYTQLLYGFKLRWAAGLRYEYVNGDARSLDEDFAAISHSDDPFRDERHRFSPLLAWYPTEYSRFRLQYNYDHAAHIPGKDAHSFWIGAEFLLGAHAAHKF
jgi:hypothetical protein